jgi:hypothetical protein
MAAVCIVLCAVCSKRGAAFGVIFEGGNTNKNSEPVVGRWASEQRHLYRKGNLEADRAMKLRQVGFCFDGLSLARSLSRSRAREG